MIHTTYSQLADLFEITDIHFDLAVKDFIVTLASTHLQKEIFVHLNKDDLLKIVDSAYEPCANHFKIV